MRGGFKNYLFNKIENYKTVETKDIYNHLDDGTYSIEHIMPQKLNDDWFEELGDNAEEIHEKWIHKLGKLLQVTTLTWATLLLLKREMESMALRRVALG